MKIGIEGESTVMFFLCIAIAIFAAWFMNRIIEKPFLKWREIILKRRHTKEVDRSSQV
jgi:peptidoglycan/LPS O-acetylase OafA/YrhL